MNEEPPIVQLRADLAHAILSGAIVVRDTEITMLEDEIERRGLQDRYLDALVCILGFVDGLAHPVDLDMWLCGNVTPSDVFAILRATPEQKAKAYISVMEYLHPHPAGE